MKKVLLFFLLSVILLQAQNSVFTHREQLQGYAIKGDTSWFIFNPSFYNADAKNVTLTGSFCGWSGVMDNLARKLYKSGDMWVLPIYNKDFATVPVKAEFKFRINDGQWQAPPVDAPNEKGGNLVFAYDQQMVVIKSEIVSQRDVRIIFVEGKPTTYNYDPANYTITTVRGDTIPCEKVLYLASGVLQLVPVRDINIRRMHFVTVKDHGKTVPVKYDGWFKHIYSDKALGANYDPKDGQTWIRIFIPRADSVKVFLYKNPGEAAQKQEWMYRDKDGVWEYALPGNWQGWYYDFTAYGPDEPGNHFYRQNPVHFTDPWAQVSVDTWGPSRIWPKMKPATPLKNGIPPMQDVIAYEVHVQDFTRLLPLPDSLKGTFTGFAQSGLRNSTGAPVGFDHLVDLGINVVHLMPVQEYLHYPDKEWQVAFKDDPYMTEQGINLENYQWGYRTSHAFALESRYRVKGSTWGAQNRQFRDLVQAFHDHNIAVVVDVVFNHTAEKMDNRMMYFNFAAMDVPYFYRTNDEMDFIGEYGTETKSEERPMMQRWIIEQVTNMVQQYGIDGIRIDLAGQTDQQTLLALHQVLGPDKIIYGEPWIASADPDYENNPDWDWYKDDAPITFFQDDSRNAFKGPTSNPQNKQTDRGYAGGNGDRDDVKMALSAGFPSDKTPVAGINYLDIHDNWALADRFAKTDWDGRKGVDEGAYKIAATLLFTSLGPVIIHGGSEFMRSKGVAPLVELVKHMASGPIYIRGKRDSYNLARANQFVWENLGRNFRDGTQIKCNYQQMNDFWKGLIALRRSSYGQVFRIATKPVANYYRWIEPENKRLLGYNVANRVFVLLNTDEKAGHFDFELTTSQWRLIGNNDTVNINKLINGKDYSILKAGKHSIDLPAESLLIWVNDGE